MKVCKFGGTSLADATQIKKVCNIILSDKERRLVVVSAPGKRFDNDIKVTDLLIACASARLSGKSAEGELATVIDRYASIANDLDVPEVIEDISKNLTERVNVEFSDSGKFMDAVKAAGEDNCAKLVAAYLEKSGHPAMYINPKDAGLFLSDAPGNAVVLEKSYNNLKKLSEIDKIGIFPGFFGYSEAGDIVTFPRGGSDTTGAVLASAVEAELYENFTDVDYVYAASPKIIKDPAPILEMTYREMRELSYAGFNVYQDEALLPVYRNGIHVRIKNVNNPSIPGTLIAPTRKNHKHRPLAGVACDSGFCYLNITKYLMNREVGFGRKVLSILEDEGISFEHMPSGIDSLSIILRESMLSQAIKDRILHRVKAELNVDDAHFQGNISLIMISGEGMLHTVGISARAGAALCRAGVNIEMISQGALEISMVFAVATEDSKRAVSSIYNEFFN